MVSSSGKKYPLNIRVQTDYVEDGDMLVVSLDNFNISKAIKNTDRYDKIIKEMKKNYYHVQDVRNVQNILAEELRKM